MLVSLTKLHPHRTPNIRGQHGHIGQHPPRPRPIYCLQVGLYHWCATGWTRASCRNSVVRPVAATAKPREVPATQEEGPLEDLKEWPEGEGLIVLEDYAALDEDGNPTLMVLDPDKYRVVPKLVYTEDVLEEVDQVDLEPKYEVPNKKPTEIPGGRVIVNSEELDWIGEGLPIITGGEWPDCYWKAIEEINSGREVAVPTPHPKFTVKDLERISQQGPAFEDVVLEHVERIYQPNPDYENSEDLAVAEAYTYIPFTVLGDFHFEVEPNWLDLPQLNFYEFYQGLRQRNWTSPHYDPQAAPWRVQFFKCCYEGVTDWRGWRAVVTKPGGERCWVDMPRSGVDAFLRDYTSPGDKVDGTLWAPKRTPGELVSPTQIGYNQVFEQVFQAYEQRLPAEGIMEFVTQETITPGAYPYDCPGEALLDVSWHQTENPVQGPFQQWLMRPDFASLVGAVRTGIEKSGLLELKLTRDVLSFVALPAPPKIHLYWDPNNAGPLYFLICLTAGVVIPALRRSKILDIKTLEEDPGAAQEFARSKATARKEGLTGVEFSDIAGLDPILNEVLEVVEFLKDPKVFSKLGARPPKGILLEGDPGTGKTLLAKALAGEAMVPFYQMSGTEFTEGIVGLGAARIRDLFKRARVSAPCVIFVDELDALGLKRADADSGKANEEREQTLNQLLTEMDGFTPDVGVVFIGATNRADLLDPALMRPGRFDRKIRMPKPDTEGRYEILKLHLRKKQLEPDVDLLQLARDLPGLVGADLANIVNEAQLNAVRRGSNVLSKKDIYAGVDRFTQGELRPPLPRKNKLPVLCFAAKEAGIALVAQIIRERDGRIEPVERVSIQPKGKSYSRTMFARGTDEDYQIITRGRMLDRIKVALAGSIAVRVILGEETNFAIADIKRACRLADKMVFYYGMSDFGITTWAKQPYSEDFFLGSHRPRKVISVDAMDSYADWPTRVEDFRFDPLDPSDVTWHRYTDISRQIIKQCYEEVWAMLESHKDALWAGVKELADKKELLGAELREVFSKHPPVELKAPPQLEMTIFTEGDNKRWPYGVVWLNDAYPIPHWVRVQQEKEKKEKEKETVTQS